LNNYPKQGFLPLFARLERQLSLPLRLRFPILNEHITYEHVSVSKLYVRINPPALLLKQEGG